MAESGPKRRGSARRQRLRLEPLEPRVLLSGSLVISEFMALNHETLQDSFGDHSDWIEIHNSGSEAVNLDGWFLTDDQDELTKWRFPEVALEPDAYLVVFASGRDIAQPGQELHTNFALSSDGEYLALVEPDGQTIASEYSPRYPDQRADVSYGIGHDIQVTSLLEAGAPCSVYVSATTPPPPDWAERTFDDSAWLAGTTGVGFEQSVPGFAVWTHKANVTVGNLDVAEQVVADPAKQSWTEAANSTVANFFNTGGHGHYDANEQSFPGLFINQDANDYVVHITADLIIPSAGQWTIGANTDDGFRLTISGVTTSSVTNSSTPVGGDTISYYNPRGPGDTLGVFDFPAAGKYSLEVVFYERGGGSELELFAAPGAHSSWNASDFDLIGDTDHGGLAVEAQVVGSGSELGYGNLIATDIESEMFGATPSAFIALAFALMRRVGESSRRPILLEIIVYSLSGLPADDDCCGGSVSLPSCFSASFLSHCSRSNPESDFTTVGNWVIIENSGLATAAILFPEFKESRKWLDQAFGRLDRELGRQVYPDGCQKELTTGYHQVCINCFRRAMKIKVPVVSAIDKVIQASINLACRFIGNFDGAIVSYFQNHELVFRTARLAVG